MRRLTGVVSSRSILRIEKFLLTLSRVCVAICTMITDPNLEAELARRRALDCLHDAGRILSDATSLFPSLDERKAVTQIVGEIHTIEQKLDSFARNEGF